MEQLEHPVATLTGECLRRVLSHLSAADLMSASRVGRHWRAFLAGEDSLWQRLCAADWALPGPEAPDRSPLPSYRAAYAAWHVVYGRYGELGRRAAAAWRRAEDWTAAHLPPVAVSLRPGASAEELHDAGTALGVALPPALCALYAGHDGQVLEFDRRVDAQRTAMHDSLFHGLFGGYSFYSHMVSTRMLPLKRMVLWTRRLRQRLPPGALGAKVLFAASYNFNKLVFCDASTGGVSIATVDKVTCIDATPSRPGGDGMLHWFESYAAALAAGAFRAAPIDAELEGSTGINLFPQAAPQRSEAVTAGIRVRASPLFVPELTQLGAGGDNQYFFAYSVQFALLPEADQLALAEAAGSGGAPLRSVQLRSRHWVIRDASGGVESEVRGEAVVGHYPLLRPGAPDFEYQSCTHQHQGCGSMEGDFAFVEGSLEEPGAREVVARCAPFRLDVPGVVF